MQKPSPTQDCKCAMRRRTIKTEIITGHHSRVRISVFGSIIACRQEGDETGPNTGLKRRDGNRAQRRDCSNCQKPGGSRIKITAFYTSYAVARLVKIWATSFQEFRHNLGIHGSIRLPLKKQGDERCVPVFRDISQNRPQNLRSLQRAGAYQPDRSLAPPCLLRQSVTGSNRMADRRYRRLRLIAMNLTRPCRKPMVFARWMVGWTAPISQ